MILIMPFTDLLGYNIKTYIFVYKIDIWNTSSGFTVLQTDLQEKERLYVVCTLSY